jgi:hypothetical protein
MATEPRDAVAAALQREIGRCRLDRRGGSQGCVRGAAVSAAAAGGCGGGAGRADEEWRWRAQGLREKGKGERTAQGEGRRAAQGEREEAHVRERGSRGDERVWGCVLVFGVDAKTAKYPRRK